MPSVIGLIFNLAMGSRLPC
uniref:Uncharacterized protein n=1 Tax=Arundo donax TaxID=35708 RepID=A0A0A9ABX3_ARUDO